jgi:hypothetical protein
MEWKLVGPDNRFEATHEKLGTFVIYRDPPTPGWCVDINGNRAWSAWRGTHDSVKYNISNNVRTWEYLEKFRPK